MPSVRETRERAFPPGGEEPFCFQLCLELLEALEQVAGAGLPHCLDVELEIAAGFVQADQHTGFDAARWPFPPE